MQCPSGQRPNDVAVRRPELLGAGDQDTGLGAADLLGEAEDCTVQIRHAAFGRPRRQFVCLVRQAAGQVQYRASGPGGVDLGKQGADVVGRADADDGQLGILERRAGIREDGGAGIDQPYGALRAAIPDGDRMLLRERSSGYCGSHVSAADHGHIKSFRRIHARTPLVNRIEQTRQVISPAGRAAPVRNSPRPNRLRSLP
jgi:hypothetical protein